MSESTSTSRVTPRRHVVARLSEIPPGGRKIVRVGRVEIGVFNVDGTLYALTNACPHHGAPLCQGVDTGTNLPSDLYTYDWGREGLVLRCPWHAWEFDLTTGRSLFDPTVHTRSYRVAAEAEDVVIYV